MADNTESISHLIGELKRQVIPQIDNILKGKAGGGKPALFDKTQYPTLNDVIPFFMYECIERQESILARQEQVLTGMNIVQDGMAKDSKALVCWTKVIAGLTISLVALTIVLAILTVVLIKHGQ